MIRSLILVLILGAPLLWAEENEGAVFSGKIGVESGTFQPAQDALHPYVYSHLELETHPGITEGFSLDLEGQANGLEAGVPAPGHHQPEDTGAAT